jgi:hypothetical protein
MVLAFVARAVPFPGRRRRYPLHLGLDPFHVRVSSELAPEVQGSKMELSSSCTIRSREK